MLRKPEKCPSVAFGCEPTGLKNVLSVKADSKAWFILLRKLFQYNYAGWRGGFLIFPLLK